MGAMTPSLDLSLDVVDLTEAVCNVESVSLREAPLADAIEAVLRPLEHLEVERLGNSIVARTHLGRDERVVIAGHIDTVPLNDNLPVRRDEEFLHGLGTCDMKGGVAVALKLAATLPEPNRDITYVFYEGEEIDAEFNGLKLIGDARPELLEADFAILMEPSDGIIEAGCQGTLRVEVRVPGEAAHAARSWRGSNAIHSAADVLARLQAYDARRPVVDGLEYHEGLNAVLISGGTATNVVPRECIVTVNHRFAPDRTEEEAADFVRDFFSGYEVTLVDTSPGARPGLDRPAARDFAAAVGGEVKPKFGWTDVARFTGLGIPAVNFGPGDPMYAHKADERVPISQLISCEAAVRAWLGGAS